MNELPLKFAGLQVKDAIMLRAQQTQTRKKSKKSSAIAANATDITNAPNSDFMCNGGNASAMTPATRGKQKQKPNSNSKPKSKAEPKEVQKKAGPDSVAVSDSVVTKRKRSAPANGKGKKTANSNTNSNTNLNANGHAETYVLDHNFSLATDGTEDDHYDDATATDAAVYNNNIGYGNGNNGYGNGIALMDMDDGFIFNDIGNGIGGDGDDNVDDYLLDGDHYYSV